MGGLIAWRHPVPQGAAGRCVGQVDLAVDRRKAKRLAHRIRAFARGHAMPRVVITSPLERSAAVGRRLAAWGWQHRIDPHLSELDFGAWDGRAWRDVPIGEIDAWCADFGNRRAGGTGESVGALLGRCARFVEAHRQERLCIVGHAGWLNAARWLAENGAAMPTAAAWPQAPDYGARRDVTR